jgi:hypothetical protein
MSICIEKASNMLGNGKKVFGLGQDSSLYVLDAEGDVSAEERGQEKTESLSDHDGLYAE